MTHRSSVAVVTGASMGIGRELARLFANDGYGLVLVARSDDKLQALAEELGNDFGVTSHVVTADLSQQGAPLAVFEKIDALGVEVEFLANNAGFGTTGAFADLPLDRELEMIDLNINALVALTHLGIARMRKRGGGRILNIASTAGFQPGPGMAVYYATKAFVISFSEAVAHELRGTGITVTAHCPGATGTNFADTAGNADTPLFRLAVADTGGVAKHAYRAMHRGKVLAIAGILNWIGAFSVRFSPRAAVRRITAWANGR